MGQQKRHEHGFRDSIIDFKNIKIPGDVVSLASQIISVRSKKQLSYWLHTGWFSYIGDKSL